ncbi:alpha/beta fold hydrolase [Streptomyces sp. NPDC002225]|uniref:thioesterase II family protein n=1 Tax=Streptomyces sp. NPDC002225 TaxID=3154413 RepID=UPI003327555C
MAERATAAARPGRGPGTPWIRAFGPPGPAAPVRLVCFPHAGGAAGYFRDWGEGTGAQVWAVQYPGRENRIREPFSSDLHALADRAAEVLGGLLDRPTVFFGHSMGAVVGYEVLRRLAAEDRDHAVRHLVVSGCGAPHRVRPFAGQEAAHLLSDDRLVALLRSLGADNTALLDDPGMRSAFLPAVRDDYRIVQSYVPRTGGPVLRTDVTAFVGRQDEAVGVGDAGAWATVTRGRFALRTFPGGHFYPGEHPDEVLRAVREVLGPPVRGVHAAPPAPDGTIDTGRTDER